MIEEIEHVALVPSADVNQLRLRLLTPDPQSGCNNHFDLTPAHAVLPEESHVTVSYTWAHKQSTTGLEIPEYKIQDLANPDAALRAPHCPPIVFHGVMNYGSDARR